ncbi:nucleoside hydrolase [Candidatus Nitrospira bockiana]
MLVFVSVVRSLRTAILAALALAATGAAFLLATLAMPVETWRTGELPAPSLPLEPAQPFSPAPVRVWIDSDAACGQDRRADPDDCLALLLLTQDPGVEVVGVSTVFGNAAFPETDRTARALLALVEQDTGRAVPVHRGSPGPLAEQTPIDTAPLHEAHERLRAALEQGPLAILALGPLTNVAVALEGRPELRARVTRLIAVMGRRKGHVFHPIEGGTARSFLGHGPVFRDFNVTQDEKATAAVVALGVPTTLIPYEAARAILVDAALLHGLTARGGAAAWVAQGARSWLAYWREEIGRDGFYPFDLIAAAYAVQPSLLHCAEVPIAVEDDTWLFGWLGYRGLFVVSEEQADSRRHAAGTALYCPEVSEHLQSWLARRLAGSSDPVPSR